MFDGGGSHREIAWKLSWRELSKQAAHAMALSKEPFLFKEAHLREFWHTPETPRSQLTDGEVFTIT
jgi:hypothetical protein